MNKLVTAEDILGNAHDFIECVWMAATDLEEPLQRGPLQAVATAAADKINEAIALLHEYRESRPVPTAPDAKPKSPAARTKRGGK